MPGYVRKSLVQLSYNPRIHSQYSSHKPSLIQYSKQKLQQAVSDNSPFLSTEKMKHIQSTTGSFLYYGPAIEYAILLALNDISATQLQATTKNNRKNAATNGFFEYT